MRNAIRTFVIAALAGAVTLTSFNLSPAQAAPKAKAQVEQSTTDLSAQRRRHYRNNDRAALAMFGLVAGTIAMAAAANRYNDGYYYGGGRRYYGGYGYGAPRYGYRGHYRHHRHWR